MFDKDEIARKVVEAICGDNGIQPYPLPESLRNIDLYEAIAAEAENFHEKNPDFVFTDEIIEEMAVGEQNEADEKYMRLPGYEELSEAMNNFFEMYDDGTDYED